MGSILKGKQVSRIEALYGQDIERILLKHEEEAASCRWVAKKYGVHWQTVHLWRRKLGFPLRRNNDYKNKGR